MLAFRGAAHTGEGGAKRLQQAATGCNRLQGRRAQQLYEYRNPTGAAALVKSVCVVDAMLRTELPNHTGGLIVAAFVLAHFPW